MKRLLAASFACVMYAASPAAQTSDATSGSVQRAFAPGGELRMNLSAGDYRISGTDENIVRIDWSVRYPDQARQVDIAADVDGRRARIHTDGPRGNFRVRIQVPSRSDLHVRLTAGDLTVDGIDGNKDIQSHAGDIEIDMRRAEDYNRVDATVWAGDLRIAPLRVSKGGLFRSYRWDGRGPYRLRAHLKAGDLRIR